MTEKAFINTVTEGKIGIKKKAAVKMLFVVVGILAGVLCSEGGILRQNLALGIPHPLSINRELLQAQLLPRDISYAVRDSPEKDVSYTLSYEDYLYLKRHKVEGQDSPFNPDPTDISPPIDNIKGKLKYDPVKHNVPRLDSVLKRSVGTNSINGYNNIVVSAPVVPEVHKHVYFHVPPPDFEETPAALRVIQPAKKKVNILFIKVPSYEPSRAYLQQLLQSQAPIEDKTLIYVLSKSENPENIPQPVVLPSKPSPPEVYFVKYRTPNDIEPINNELLLPSLLQNVSPVLEPRRATRDP